MKKITLAAAGLMLAAAAHADQPEFPLVDGDILPTREAQKPTVVAKQDPRFGAYAIEYAGVRR